MNFTALNGEGIISRAHPGINCLLLLTFHRSQSSYPHYPRALIDEFGNWGQIPPCAIFAAQK